MHAIACATQLQLSSRLLQRLVHHICSVNLEMLQ